MPSRDEGELRMEEIKMDAETLERRRRATARFMLRVIAAEQKHGINRPDAVEFKARMERQAKQPSVDPLGALSQVLAPRSLSTAIGLGEVLIHGLSIGLRSLRNQPHDDQRSGAVDVRCSIDVGYASKQEQGSKWG
jgi:hypothetical protein